eukprot:2947595-Rhodomonas_salina.1
MVPPTSKCCPEWYPPWAVVYDMPGTDTAVLCDVQDTKKTLARTCDRNKESLALGVNRIRRVEGLEGSGASLRDLELENNKIKRMLGGRGGKEHGAEGEGSGL